MYSTPFSISSLSTTVKKSNNGKIIANRIIFQTFAGHILAKSLFQMKETSQVSITWKPTWQRIN
jgi:hypothetical protein